MTRYQPIDHWYDTNNAKVTPMLPWAVMTTVPNGLTSGSPVCGQTLNLFNTGTQLINEASAAYNDLCHVKWVASSATPALDSFYNNLISDRTRTTAINLIGLNITPVSLTTVMLGKVSSISGIYYVGGQGLTYGDVISAVNANNSFVNYIVLPAKDVFIGPVDTTNEDVTLKLAVPLA
jgi:hypothetical protein